MKIVPFEDAAVWPSDIEFLYQQFKKRLMNELLIGISDGVINPKIMPQRAGSNPGNFILVDKGTP